MPAGWLDLDAGFDSIDEPRKMGWSIRMDRGGFPGDADKCFWQSSISGPCPNRPLLLSYQNLFLTKGVFYGG